MSTRLSYVLTALCGLLGTAALVAYYAAPYTFLPLPPDNATAEQVMDFGTHYAAVILLDAWLQVVGSLLSVIFAIALVHLAGASRRLAGRLVMLVSGVTLTLSMVEAMLAIGAVQAGALGQAQTALVCFDLTTTFIHIFLIAPSLFLALGAAIFGTRILPRGFGSLALALGVVFQVLGVAGLFNSSALPFVIGVLLAQEAWTVTASVALAAWAMSMRGRTALTSVEAALAR
ncbi:MAG TPA: hypothetical protein VF120_16165 [Ktedonobacterales bacterium]